MTQPHDDQETRPISVAELLARNGSIGSPPVGGRRRRKRGNNDAVTVAELTGEIPLIGPEAANGTAEHDTAADRDVADETIDEASDEADALEEEATIDHDVPDVDHDDLHEPDDDEQPRLDDGKLVSAEEMAPDALEVDDDIDDITSDLVGEESTDTPRGPDEHDDAEELPLYLKSSPQPMFGGREGRDLFSDGDTMAVRTPAAADDAVDEGTDTKPPSPAQKILSGTLVVAQSILAVAFGAGLFIAFDQLWKWNPIVALVLAVLVILGLVAAVWVVRKTEDIASTLIAVAVGALVTMGPLVLHTN
jgi:F0F1-type ATP synthase assembly protein I